MYKRYTKAYIGWAVLLFFSSFGLAALNLYLGSIVLLVSIGLFAHQSAIRVKDGELQILSQFIVLKIWRKYPLDTINKITLSSVAQMGGGIASRSGGRWTRHTYCINFYSTAYNKMPKYYIQNYSKGIEVLKVIAQNNASIELKDFVREAQQKALKRRAQIKKKREKTINARL